MNWPEELQTACPNVELRLSEPMSKHVSMRVGGPAAAMGCCRDCHAVFRFICCRGAAGEFRACGRDQRALPFGNLRPLKRPAKLFFALRA